jgi:hypothetical protein
MNTTLPFLNQLANTFGSANWETWQFNRWCYYDHARLAPAGTNSVDLFINPVGATDPVSGLAKTKEETNIPKPRSFGTNFFFISQVRTVAKFLPLARQPAAIASDPNVLFTTFGNAMSAFAQLIRSGVYVFTLNDKEFLRIPQPFVNAPAGADVEIHNWASDFLTGYTSPSHWIQQGTNVDNVFAQTPPQLVEPEVTVKARIDFPTGTPVFTNLVNAATPAIQIGVILDGYLARPAS